MSQTPSGDQVIAGTNMLSVIATSKTRPGDTATYAAGDTISEATSSSTVWTFSKVVRKAGGSGTIGQVVIDDSSSPALKLQAELWLFDTAPTADQDNAAFTPTDAEMQTVVAVIPINGSHVGTASGNTLLTSGAVAAPFRCASNVQDLFGVLVARNAYIPTNAEVFNIRLSIYQD